MGEARGDMVKAVNVVGIGYVGDGVDKVVVSKVVRGKEVVVKGDVEVGKVVKVGIEGGMAAAIMVGGFGIGFWVVTKQQCR